MKDDSQRIAELEKELAHLKKAISHNNDLIVGLERAFLDTVYTLVEEDDDLQKVEKAAVELDYPTAIKTYFEHFHEKMSYERIRVCLYLLGSVVTRCYFLR